MVYDDQRPTRTRPVRVAAGLAALVGLTVALAGCGSSPAPTGDPTGPPAVEEGSASSSATPRRTQPVAAGSAIQLPAEDGGARVTVGGFSVAEDSPGPRLVVETTVEAPDAVAHIPNAFLLCAGSKAAGRWQPESSLFVGETVAAGTRRQGRINLLVPGGRRDHAPFPECKAPATVAFGSPVSDLRRLVQVMVPTDVVDDLNEAVWRANDVS